MPRVELAERSIAVRQGGVQEVPVVVARQRFSRHGRRGSEAMVCWLLGARPLERTSRRTLLGLQDESGPTRSGRISTTAGLGQFQDHQALAAALGTALVAHWPDNLGRGGAGGRQQHDSYDQQELAAQRQLKRQSKAPRPAVRRGGW
jgi:hypothetical protein